MLNIILVASVIAAGVILIWIVVRARPRPPFGYRSSSSGKSDVYIGLRNIALTARRIDIGVPPSASPGDPWCVVMDMAYERGTFTGRMQPTQDFPVPKVDETIFYVRSGDGVVTSMARTDDLGEQRHELAPLFHAMQDVITQYREIEQSAPPEAIGGS